MDKDLKTWAGVVLNLFTDLLDGNDLVLRPAIVPWDGYSDGTIVTIVHRNAKSGSGHLEEHFSSCDFKTFSGLARAFLRRANTHGVVNGASVVCAWNKACSPESNRALAA